MMAKAVAQATTASFISVVGSEFVQKYLGEARASWLDYIYVCHGLIIYVCVCVMVGFFMCVSH